MEHAHTPLAVVRMRRHVRSVAEEAGIRLTWVAGPDAWRKAECFPRLREAVVPEIDDGGDYLICLHELGHVLAPGLPDPDDLSDMAQLASEALAWSWAVTTAETRLLAPEDHTAALLSLWTHFERVLGSEVPGSGPEHSQEPALAVVAHFPRSPISDLR